MTQNLEKTTGEESVSAGAPSPRRRGRKFMMSGRAVSAAQRQGLLLLLVALAVYMKIASPYFLTATNMATIASVSGILAVMAVVQTPLIVSGGLDISVGSTIAISSVWLIKLNNAGVNIWLSVLIAVVIGAIVGFVNGSIVVWMHINPFITTLGTMSIFSGLAYMTSINNFFNKTSASFTYLGTGKIVGVPVPFVVAIVLAAIVLIFERLTVVGRAVYAIGGNREAARFAGLHVNRIPFLLYVFSGVSAAIAGVLLTAQLGSASPDIGATYTLQVVTAVILGGVSLAGGRGSVTGTFIAVLFLGVLGDGFTLLETNAYLQTVILGVALITAVLIDQASQRIQSSNAQAVKVKEDEEIAVTS